MLLLCLLLGLSAHARLVTPSTEEYINSLISRWNSSGLAMAVVRQDNTSETGWHHEFASYGIANAREDPVTPDTVFAIASNSKLFLACSVGLLIENSTLLEERGKELKWSTKAKEVFGDIWKLMDDDMDRGVNIQDMLSHRTGMPRHDYSGTPREGGVAEMISTMRYLRPSAEFRQTFQYNNLMYESLSYLPELFLNQTFESYVDQHLFRPLNMSSSTYSVKEAEERGTFADGFQSHMRDLSRGINGTRRATVPYFFRPGEERIWAGAGGVLSSARDLAMWASMLLNDGRHPYTNETIVPSSVVQHVATGVTASEGKAQYPELSPKVYGAGQWRYSYRGHEIIEHGGNNPGFRTQVARFPNDNLAIISLSNDANGFYLMEAAKWRIADDILFGEGNHLDWNSRYEETWTSFVNNSQKLTPRPEPPTFPTAPLTSLAERTYNHPTYGTLQPCLVPSSPSSTPKYDRVLQDTHAAEYTHKHCDTVLASLPVQRILDRTNLTIPTLIIPWSRFFVSHLRVQHFTDNLFNVTVVWSNAETRKREGFAAHRTQNTNLGYPRDYFDVRSGNKQQEVFSRANYFEEWEDEGDMLIGLDDHFELEWFLPSSTHSNDVNMGEEGLTFKGGIWGMEGPDASSPKGQGKKSAEVWFTRI